MFDSLSKLLMDGNDLSGSIYDVAAVALYDGPNRSACLAWLLDARNADGSWGEILSWQDRYLCTYSAAVAMLVAGQKTIARIALARLGEIPECFPDNWTANFGGLVAALDAYAARRLSWCVEHPAKVQAAVVYDTKKWSRITGHDAFYNPLTSIAGFFAEWAYVLPAIELERLLVNFQVANGSISNCPSASVFFLMACQERGFCPAGSLCLHRLKDYVERLDPTSRDIAMLDQVPHFVTAWLLLYVDHTACQPLPDVPSVRSLRAAVSKPGQLVSVGGETTFPGDMDTTACAVIGLNLPLGERERVMGSFDDLFNDDHYITFRYERTPSVTTNVHAVAAWPENPRAPKILDWLAVEIAASGDLPRCKWHCSP